MSSFKETNAVSNKKNLIEFGEVVKGQKGEEVARFFLSTLMLANTENVQISTKAGTDPQLGKITKLALFLVISIQPSPGMDNVELCLLTTTRHHQQLADFQAASQADPAAAGPEVDAGAATQQATVNTVEEGPYKAKKRTIA